MNRALLDGLEIAGTKLDDASWSEARFAFSMIEEIQAARMNIHHSSVFSLVWQHPIKLEKITTCPVLRSRYCVM